LLCVLHLTRKPVSVSGCAPPPATCACTRVPTLTHPTSCRDAARSTAVDFVKHMVKQGHLQDMTFMICKLRQMLGDCTFLEAFERTGRILNVTVCPADTNEPPRLLNYMTAPNVRAHCLLFMLRSLLGGQEGVAWGVRFGAVAPSFGLLHGQP
jgi:hypothetical protein